MSPWKPLIAAIVACLLMAVYVVDRQQLQAQRQTSATAARLIPFDVLEAQSIKLKNQFGEFELEKNDAGIFMLIKPITSKTDEGQVKALVDNFYGAKISQSFTTEDPAEFGFDDPQAVVSFVGELEGKTITRDYEIGSKSGTLGRVYLRDPKVPYTILTTNDWVANQSQKDLDLLRDKTLITLRQDEVKSFSIKKETGVLTVSRTDEFASGWVINNIKPANPEWVARLLRSMESLQAYAVYDNPTTSVADLGLSPANLVMTFNPESLNPQTLEFGIMTQQDESFFMKSSEFPIVSKVRSRFVREALVTPDQWQTLSLFWRPTSSYTTIEATTGDSTTLLKKVSDHWTFPEIPDLPVREEFVGQFLEILQNLKGFEYVGEKFSAADERELYGIREESYSVTLSTADEKREGFILGSLAPEAEFTYVKRIQDNSIWKVSPLDLQGLRVTRKELQDKRIATGFVKNISTCAIELSTGTTFKITFEAGLWKFHEEGKPVKVITAADANGFFDSVEAVEWNSELVSAKEDKVDIQFEFFDSTGKSIHFLKVYETQFTQRLVSTPQGFFFVNEEQFTAMLTRFTQLLQMNSAPAK